VSKIREDECFGKNARAKQEQARFTFSRVRCLVARNSVFTFGSVAAKTCRVARFEKTKINASDSGRNRASKRIEDVCF
jgi:hypothetical protein